MTEDDPGTGQVPEPFADLLAVAREMAARAYAPYSRYRVGAAARVDDGRTVRGCNVENAGYGVTLCAECGMVSELIAGGGGKLTAFVCVNGEGVVIMPCGRCRQLLSEHAARDFTILTPLGVRDLDEILPQAFGPQDMAGI
ncbi:cytidine deaminase [Brachybacterium muris]|uniref:cytidine deaminase n=1 Tax=Brachybacterium muris TaxID=219301 RepID=UPI00223AD92C|nr:cytidine deaminase [Brachybacterium muris]MCT1999428.1 cytidine deaminase [Brachybacterium muris]MCT2295299.1 cytidine deaminase [Brachybacterium muris]